MYSMYVQYVCTVCMHCMYAQYVCTVCMHCMYALYVCMYLGYSYQWFVCDWFVLYIHTCTSIALITLPCQYWCVVLVCYTLWEFPSVFPLLYNETACIGQENNHAHMCTEKMTKQLHHTNKIILSWFHFNLKKEIFVSSNFILAQPHKLAWTNTYIPF